MTYRYNRVGVIIYRELDRGCFNATDFETDGSNRKCRLLLRVRCWKAALACAETPIKMLCELKDTIAVHKRHPPLLFTIGLSADNVIFLPDAF